MFSYIKQQPRKAIFITMVMASVMLYSMIDVVPAFADDSTPPLPSVE